LYRATDRHSLGNQLLRARTESHRSPQFVQQFRLALLSGLSYKLYILRSQIEDIRRELEVRLVAHFSHRTKRHQRSVACSRGRCVSENVMEAFIDAYLPFFFSFSPCRSHNQCCRTGAPTCCCVLKNVSSFSRSPTRVCFYWQYCTVSARYRSEHITVPCMTISNMSSCSS